MNKRVTIITEFDKNSLEHINKLVNNCEMETCKVPYGVTDNRILNDKLPYHLTISAFDISLKQECISLLNNIDFNGTKITVEDIKIINGREDSYILCFTISNNDCLNTLLNVVYSKMPTQKYNPASYTFHITIDVSKDYDRILHLKNKLLLDFKSFKITINSLALYEIYPPVKIL